MLMKILEDLFERMSVLEKHLNTAADTINALTNQLTVMAEVIGAHHNAFETIEMELPSVGAAMRKSIMDKYGIDPSTLDFSARPTVAEGEIERD